jgi:hypothetical protein
MKTYNLAEALILIANDCYINPALITSIEFEDGSRRKFNFKTETGSHFVEIAAFGAIVRNTYLLKPLN